MTNRVLIITGDAHDATTLRSVLARAQDGPFEVESAGSLADALARLSAQDQESVDAIMVDLALPDSQGLDTFDALFALTPHTPIMTLSEIEDEQQTWEAIQRGAQGCLSKGHFSSYLVPQSLRNIIQRKAVEEALFIEKGRAEITLNSISDAVISTDLAGNVDYLNLAAEQMTGWPRDEALGKPIEDVMRLINGETREPVANPVRRVLRDDEPKMLTPGTILIRRNGSEAAIEDSAAPIHDWADRTKGAVMVFHDMTAAHEITRKMAHLAQHDALTNLPNRALLNDRIAQAISLAERSGTQLALLFLDLDNFKRINDSLGHGVGDELLQSVATRITGSVRSSDTVSRLGGDEFVVLLGENNSAEDAARTADKILTALANPHTVSEHELHVTSSIGISTYPADAKNAEALIKNADTAMYQAKEEGRNNYQFFKREMNVRAVERQMIEAHLRNALSRDEFTLYYQPKINLNTGEISGAEALIRWIHPEWGVVLPDRFVPVAESCGLIIPIGRWVLQQACTQAKHWEAGGYSLASIAVNISALEFRRKDFVASVTAALEASGLPAERLQLEITESVLMRDAPASAAILQQLKDLGVQLAVDDFGTGYSSLSYLNQFPIDVLKIDRSFVHDIGSNEGIIVSAVIAMGNSLMQRVVAEGVEETAQLEFLQAHHCEEGQGFLFSHAVDVEQFTQLLDTGIQPRPLPA
ncbi:putative bifunctional diguanylate cyclase/phosphodiesterase [Pseudomonas borbori]